MMAVVVLGKKKSDYTPDYNACVGKHDKFGKIYCGMLESEQFKSLTIGERLFYVTCRVQANSEKGRQCLYKHGADYNREYNHETDFVFPSSHLKKYGIDRCNASRYFRRLAEKGFIEIKENNKIRKCVNVYSFTDRWKREQW